MKLKNANEIRRKVIKSLLEDVFTREDVGLITSNTLNFPVVADDGEEGWVEIVVKVPKGTKDEEYDGYARREQYKITLKEKAEKEKKRAEEKTKKIERDKKRREKAE